MKMNKLLIIVFSVLLLAGCKSYDVEVDLPPTEEEQLYADIAQYQKEIEEFAPEVVGRSFPDLEVISMARAYEQLGQMDNAIQAYEDFLAQGHQTKALINNLGVLYEEVGETEKAVEQYQRVMDVFYDRQYLYNITWAYIRGEDRKNAEKYFNAWQLEFSKTDEQTQQALKRLREKEKEGAA